MSILSRVKIGLLTLLGFLWIPLSFSNVYLIWHIDGFPCPWKETFLQLLPISGFWMMAYFEWSDLQRNREIARVLHNFAQIARAARQARTAAPAA